MTMIRPLITCRQGSVTVEFAFMLPLLLALMLGVMEFGRALWIKQTLQYAAETAARTALADTTLSNASITKAVTDNLVGLNGVTPEVTVTATSTQINISISYSFYFLTPKLLPSMPIILTAQSKTPR
jgi:Flp pilus assembly protein TadG